MRNNSSYRRKFKQ